MVASREIYWARLDEPAGRRPVCVLTRDAAATVLTSVTVAPITTTVRGIRSEVAVGERDGLREGSVINCDGVITITRDRLDPEPVGVLSFEKHPQLDRALRYSLAIRS